MSDFIGQWELSRLLGRQPSRWERLGWRLRVYRERVAAEYRRKERLAERMGR
jgi:hypothetical protein